MHVNDPYAPQTPVEGVLHAFTRIGRRLKSKQPGDTIDHSAHLVLFVLRCNGALRLSDLANRMEIDASTASRHVRALEQAGLIRRSVDPDDGRAFRVELTEQGTEEWEAAAKASAISRPSPEPPPVTTATCCIPSSSILVGPLCLLALRDRRTTGS